MCPGIETTWKIQPFQITSSGPESDGEGDWDHSQDHQGGGGAGGGAGGGGLAEISAMRAMLAEARKAATPQVIIIIACIHHEIHIMQ